MSHPQMVVLRARMTAIRTCTNYGYAKLGSGGSNEPPPVELKMNKFENKIN